MSKTNFLLTKKNIFDLNETIYFVEIDAIKAVAIIAVIILHTLSLSQLFIIYAPFHIWHSVPVFMMVAGINSTLSISKRGAFCFSREYSSTILKKRVHKLLIPFSIVCLFEIVLLQMTGGITVEKIIITYFSGGIGPGSYFTPLFIQHLLVFPGVVWIKEKFKYQNKYLILSMFFVFSLLLEWMCIVLNVPEWLYRVLYIRYFFASVIGSYLVSHRFNYKVVCVLVLLSVIFIISTSYCKIGFYGIYPAWGFQHAPAFFYTALLIYCLWRVFSTFQRVKKFLAPIGKASYHIFLFQMVWFWWVPELVHLPVTNNFAYLGVNIFVCLAVGYVFFRLQLFMLNQLKRKC